MSKDSYIFTDGDIYIHGWGTGLLVAVSGVSSGFHVGFVTEALVDHLTVNFPSASVSQVLLPYSMRG